MKYLSIIFCIHISSIYCMHTEDNLDKILTGMKVFPQEIQENIRDRYCQTTPKLIATKVKATYEGAVHTLIQHEQPHHYSLYNTLTQTTIPLPATITEERPFFMPTLANNWLYTISKNKLAKTKQNLPFKLTEEYLIKIFAVNKYDLTFTRSYPVSKHALPLHYKNSATFRSANQHFLLLPQSNSKAKLIHLDTSIKEIAEIPMQPQDIAAWMNNDTTLTINNSSNTTTSYTINLPVTKPPKPAHPTVLPKIENIKSSKQIGNQIFYLVGTQYFVRPTHPTIKCAGHFKNYSLEQILLAETVLNDPATICPEKLQAIQSFQNFEINNQFWLIATVRNAQARRNKNKETII